MVIADKKYTLFFDLKNFIAKHVQTPKLHVEEDIKSNNHLKPNDKKIQRKYAVRFIRDADNEFV